MLVFFYSILFICFLFFFFFNDTATTEIYTLSLHDALPIARFCEWVRHGDLPRRWRVEDRKSTRLNSSHSQISYAVFCLKKKKNLNKVRFIKKKKKINRSCEI